MSSPRTASPDPAAQLFGHLLVGVATSTVVGKQVGVLGGLAAGMAAIIAHQAFDAPVARMLAEAGL